MAIGASETKASKGQKEGRKGRDGPAVLLACLYFWHSWKSVNSHLCPGP